MKVVVAGSRVISELYYVQFAIKSANIYIGELVSGGATGIDKLGEQWARDNNINIKLFPADWDQYGKSAGPMRNAEMADYCDAAIILWDGKSKGTFNMIENIKKRKKPLHLSIFQVYNWWKDKKPKELNKPHYSREFQ
jgi:hypothetical protein